MLKRMLTVTCLVVLWTNVVFAEANWELIGSKDFYSDYYKITFHNQYFIDNDSIKNMQVGMNDVIKAKIKVSNQKPEEYSIDQYWVNSDTKQWKLAFTEKYIDNTLHSQNDYRNQDWNTYDPNDMVINEILKRAN